MNTLKMQYFHNPNLNVTLTQNSYFFECMAHHQLTIDILQ